jgi:hypothetical protein
MDKLIAVLQHSWTTKAFLCTALSKHFDTGYKTSRKNKLNPVEKYLK